MDVSVIITTFNRYEMLKRALRSVQNQTFKPKEIIVVDDGSFDESSKIRDEYPQIEYIYQKNSGISSARNRGIKSASGDFVAFLDDDDEWDKDKLKLQTSFHEANQDIKISYTNEMWYRDGKRINMPKKYAKYGGKIFQKCLSHCIIAPSSVMMKRDIFDKVGYFDESLQVCEDYDMWLRVSACYDIGLIDKPLITKYAGHEGQLSFKHWGMDRFRVKALEKLCVDEAKKPLVIDELVKKLDLLIIGAKKHKRSNLACGYQKKLDLLL